MASQQEEIPHRNLMKPSTEYEWDRNKKYIQKFTHKPKGVWYQIRDEGSKWGKRASFEWGDRLYDLDIDTSNILVINTYEELVAFHEKYYKVYQILGKISYSHIDWIRIANEYSGFEINNYYKIKYDDNFDDFNMDYGWFYFMDFSSGCVWDLDIIKNITYWGEYKHGCDCDYGCDECDGKPETIRY
jgi:hypothetical protein